MQPSVHDALVPLVPEESSGGPLTSHSLGKSLNKFSERGKGGMGRGTGLNGEGPTPLVPRRFEHGEMPEVRRKDQKIRKPQGAELQEMRPASTASRKG